MNEKLETIRRISNRLLIALCMLVVLFICGAIYVFRAQEKSKENGYVPYSPLLTNVGKKEPQNNGSVLVSPPIMAFGLGCIGGFVGLQRRIKRMSDEDLTLLANSWVYICLSPLVGGILAVLIYVLFISGLLAGHLFPHFIPDFSDKPEQAVPWLSLLDVPDKDRAIEGLGVIFQIHGDAEDYAKLIFWCFLAGFSERFVTDIISKFESQTSDDSKPSGS